MKRLFIFLTIAISAITFIACDDNTDMLGSSIVPAGDEMEIDTVTL